MDDIHTETELNARIFLARQTLEQLNASVTVKLTQLDDLKRQDEEIRAKLRAMIAEYDRRR